MSAFKSGDSVRLKAFEPIVNEGDISPIDTESGSKTDYRPRWKDTFSHNEYVLLGCSLEIEDALCFGPQGRPEKGQPFWTYALEHAVQAYIIRLGLREALAERVPFGTTLAIFACGASMTMTTGDSAPTGCPDKQCGRCYPKEPRWAVLCQMSIDGKMGIESLADEVQGPLDSGTPQAE